MPSDEIPLSNLHSKGLAKSEPVINRQIQFAGGNIGSICAFNGMPLFSKGGRDWIKACSGEDLNLDSCFDTQSPGPHSFNLAIDNGFQHYESLPLPNLGFLRQQIEMFQSSLVALFFPVIDTGLFEDTIKAAYYQQPSTISLSINSAKACIFAFCAMTSVFIHELQDSSLDIAKDYTRQAYQMLSQILCEPPTIDGLQTFLLLVSVWKKQIARTQF